MVKPSFYLGPMMLTGTNVPPRIIPNTPDTFYKAIGQLIVNWGTMERYMNALVWALLKHNHTNEDGWRNRGFNKRYDLFKAEWTKFTSDHESLFDFAAKTDKQISEWKFLRDALSHKEMEVGLCDANDHAIQFYNASRTKQKSKVYRIGDLHRASADAIDAAGWFWWVCDSTSSWPLPLPETLLLRSLPNTDHLRLPS